MDYLKIFKENDIVCDIIESNGEIYFKASDIGKLLGFKNIRQSLRTFSDEEKKIFKVKTTGGEQNLSYLNLNGLKKFICKSRKKGNMLALAKILDIDVLQTTISNVENDTIQIIKKVFHHEDMVEQYKCDKYRIDLYFPQKKIAIECDELHHQIQGNIIKDNERQSYIKDKLDCIFIRYNPFDNDFDIFDVISKIHYAIILKKANEKSDLLYKMFDVTLNSLNLYENILQNENIENLKKSEAFKDYEKIYKYYRPSI